MKIRNRIKELLAEKNISQKELAQKTRLRESQIISVICRNASTGINKEHLSKIAKALEVKDISQLLEIKEQERT